MISHRVTKQQQLILSVAQAHHDHPTADMIYIEVRELDNHISRGTVYRNLEKLCENEDLLRIKVLGADRYDCRLDFHYHMICSDCGSVLDSPIAYQSELDRIIEDETGFRVIRHRTVFEGICPSCEEKHREKE